MTGNDCTGLGESDAAVPESPAERAQPAAVSGTSAIIVKIIGKVRVST
ncbi:MAG: hypothetical protein ACXVGC_08640 [Mycobacteriaceae bacterium]